MLKSIFNKYYGSLFLKNRLFLMLGISCLVFICAFFISWLQDVPYLVFGAVAALLMVDLLLLFRQDDRLKATRSMAERLSNGDDNEIRIALKSYYSFPVETEVIDEIPEQFQQRNTNLQLKLKPFQDHTVSYQLCPTKRGEYHFGKLHVYVSSPLGFISRRYSIDLTRMVPVYPSYLQLRRYQLMAASHRLTDAGIKKIRRVGQSQEFEHIKNYVPNDDFRSINWKATARRGALMINSFTDEKAQHVYCLIDKSRVMKMPFLGLSLLDYAINASLVLSNIALLKDDKAGLITISDKIGAVIPADGRAVQMEKILQVLYKEKSRFLEANMEALYATIRSVIRQRSLLFLFTNFESLSALERQLPFLKRISRFHRLVVVFFENVELKELAETPASNVEAIYTKTIAEKFIHEKKQIVKELQRHGIQALLTAPQNLTIDAINSYLQLKSRHGN